MPSPIKFRLTKRLLWTSLRGWEAAKNRAHHHGHFWRHFEGNRSIYGSGDASINWQETASGFYIHGILHTHKTDANGKLLGAVTAGIQRRLKWELSDLDNGYYWKFEAARSTDPKVYEGEIERGIARAREFVVALEAALKPLEKRGRLARWADRLHWPVWQEL